MADSTSTAPKSKKTQKREQWQARKAEREAKAANQVTPVASITLKEVHRAALLASVTGRQFEDVKFFAYSRRTRNGAVDTPLPLLANSTLIRKASAHFDYVFATGFAESGIADMDAPYPHTRASVTDDYDYSSDSDLDDEETEAVNSSSEIEDIESADAKGKGRVANESRLEDEIPPIDDLQSETKSRTVTKAGRVVFLDDIAYTTWKAFIFYSYFEELNFAPLKSEHKTRQRDEDPGNAPLCSPKSMYRLADKYDIAPLKDKAAADIKAKLSPHNILEEIFSSLTSLYAGIRAVELDYLHANIKDASIQARLPWWVEEMEEGRLPKGASAVIISLITKLNTPPTTPPIQPGMKKCPNGCTTSSYYCQSCGRTF
ncbi:hypothetical protein C8Q76DRAFT_703670 [Earliella scabrosa]|nr:hypothetical protein C8Q76DRAFT_703670 [Earliella scabrosa]